jgi:hypothetical protein
MPDAVAHEIKLGVFISYPSDDDLIAGALYDAFIELDKDRINTFKDTFSIPMGGLIGAYIQEGLKKSHWFIAVGTDAKRQNFSWCGLELGLFTAKQEVANAPKDLRTVCIYDRSIPDLFQGRKQTKIVSLSKEHTVDLSEEVFEVEEAPIFELLSEFAEYYREFFRIRVDLDTLTAHEAWAKRHSTLITNNYWKSTQSRVRHVWLPQKRIEIHVDNGDFWIKEPRKIPASADVIIDVPTYTVFEIGIPYDPSRNKMKWSEFESKVREKSGSSSLIEMINEIVVSILPDEEKAVNDHVFRAPNGFRYRVILAKHELYGNGKREFVVHFIETLKGVTGGDERTTTLASGIMLASKYRFLFLEEQSRYSPKGLASKTGRSLLKELKHLLKDLDRVHIQAADDGLADVSALTRLLGNNDDLPEMFIDWWTAVDRLKSGVQGYLDDQVSEIDVQKKIEDFCLTTRSLNHQFLALAMEKYLEILPIEAAAPSV